MSNAEAIARYLELTPDERPITSLPLHYTFGLSVVHSHWLAGAAVVVTDEGFIQPTFWEAFRDHGCTSLAGVPFSYRILERLGFRDMDLPSLTSMQQAGGALEPELTAVYAGYMSGRGRSFLCHVRADRGDRSHRLRPPRELAAQDRIGRRGHPRWPPAHRACGRPQGR